MNVYKARHAGREYCCSTEGSDHYKEGGLEPLDLMIAKGIVEDFCIGNISKYAFRFKKTRNLEDLKKVSDYAHILCGVELGKVDKPEPEKPVTVEPWGAEDEQRVKKICTGRECKNCPMPSLTCGTTENGITCDEWQRAHTAEARAIMDEWEAEHGRMD